MACQIREKLFIKGCDMRQVKVTEKMTQSDIVLKHLTVNKKQGITPMDAFNFYGITRLAGVVFFLRQNGAEIRTIQETAKSKNGYTQNYARYTLKRSEA